MAPIRSGRGYWLVASDGGIFSFDAPFYGSPAGQQPDATYVEMQRTTSGQGYRVVGYVGSGSGPFDAVVRKFGDAYYYGRETGLRFATGRLGGHRTGPARVTGTG